MADKIPTHQEFDVQKTLNTAIQHHAASRLDEAERIYHTILEAAPEDPRAYQLLGAIAHQRGNNESAVELYEKAIILKPDYADAHYNLGIALREQGKLEEAVASFRQTVTIKPELAQAHSNLGIALQELGAIDEAISSFQMAIAINSEFSEAHSNLGIALQKIEDLDGALASFDAALKINPENAMAHNNLGKALLEQGRLDEAIAHYRKALSIKPDYANAYSNLLLSLNYQPDSTPSEKLETARRFGALMPKHDANAAHPNGRDPNRRLRIGFVSGDFRNHSVAHFLLDVLTQIDTHGFELYAYSTHHKEDQITQQLKGCFATWRRAFGIGPQQLADLIQSDTIDILVDLSGHTANNRLPAFARKPAPVQVTWMGYSGTTGLSEMDYILCDEWVIPAEEENAYAENPWRLPDGYLCYSASGLDVRIDAPPFEENACITFGSFNNLSKMSDATVKCWANLLLALHGSQLMLKSKQLGQEAVRENVMKRFEAHGVRSDQLILEGRTPDQSEHLARYNKVDIALDPFPYCGTTTTAEALCMGVPVITLRGKGFVSHVGESILNNIGHTEWIADTPEDYVSKAVYLAARYAELRDLRQSLRDSVKASPLCDASRFARNLETAFRGMWKNWCGSKTG